jgi:O-antigen ligase
MPENLELSGYMRNAARPIPFGLINLCCIPIAAAAQTSQGMIGGLAFSGWLWVLFLATTTFSLLNEAAARHDLKFPLSCACWLPFMGLLWLSLFWCDGLGRRNIQDAVQISMPILIATAASFFVRDEAQLGLLLKMFAPTLLLLCINLGLSYYGLIDNETQIRVLALSAVLVGCVLMAGCPPLRLEAMAGWALCTTLTVVTGSRMATVALLMLPALHPRYRNQLYRGFVLAGMALAGMVLFYSPVFQERFFYDGQGTLSDVFAGEFLSFGRFETWPFVMSQIERHPLLGAGVGSASEFILSVSDGEMAHPHNDYLRIAFECGLVGLAMFVGALLWQLGAAAYWIRRTAGVTRIAFTAVFLGFAALGLVAYTDNVVVYNLSYTNPLFAILGAAHGVVSRRPAEAREAH